MLAMAVVIVLVLSLGIFQIYNGMFANNPQYYLPQVGIGGGPGIVVTPTPTPYPTI